MFKKNEIVLSIFSDHRGIKTNQLQEKNWKNYQYVKIKQHSIEQMGQKRSQRETKKYLETNENRYMYNIPKLTGCSKSSAKREVHKDKCLL